MLDRRSVKREGKDISWIIASNCGFSTSIFWNLLSSAITKDSHYLAFFCQTKQKNAIQSKKIINSIKKCVAALATKNKFQFDASINNVSSVISNFMFLDEITHNTIHLTNHKRTISTAVAPNNSNKTKQKSNTQKQ